MQLVQFLAHYESEREKNRRLVNITQPLPAYKREEYTKLFSELDVTDGLPYEKVRKNLFAPEPDEIPTDKDLDEYMSLQSGIVKAENPDTVSSSVTTFVDENNDWTSGINHMKDDSYYAADTGDVSLSAFFARPIEIGRVDWASNATNTVSLDLDPWLLFWANSRNVNRIANYRNLRANLKVKVMLNGSPFHYGRAICVHSPMGATDDYLDSNSLTQLSQLPHLYIDPSTSQGGEITIPYIHHFNSFNILTADWTGRSRVYIRGMTPLGHLAGSTGKITITVFCWAEDVVLSCPTSSNPNTLSPQAGPEDEYGKGIISRPAYAVAHHAGLLRNVPFLRPYATATQIGAGALGDVARMFGFSRPTNVSETRFAKPSLTQTFANADSSDTCPKLTFDSKQETCVDPRTAGFGPLDHMAFKNIVNRESYLTQFKWNKETDGAGTMLFNIGVSPWHVNQDRNPPGGDGPFDMPACAFIAMPFRKWRGSLKFRFQFCVSPMHKGRVRISYDPALAPNGEVETNTALNEIVDIGATNDFVIEVGWHALESYKVVSKPGTVPTNQLFGRNPLVLNPNNRHNGVLYCHVVNELVSPSTAPASSDIGDVYCNVFLSAGEDFEVVDPDGNFFESYLYRPQSGTEVLASDSSAPEGPPVLRKFGNGCDPNHTLIYHADPVVSIRTLVKRYTFYRRNISAPFSGAVSPYVWTLLQSPYPLQKGRTAGGRLNGINYVHFIPLTYFAAAFVGSRGGVRHKMMLSSSFNADHICSIMRVGWQANESNAIRILEQPVNSVYNHANTLLQRNTGWGGMAVTHSKISPLIEAEFPNHFERRYYRTRDANAAGQGSELFYRVEVAGAQAPQNATITLDDHVAAADDYSLFCFLAAPSLYIGTLT
jgi:hypothetical protein